MVATPAVVVPAAIPAVDVARNRADAPPDLADGVVVQFLTRIAFPCAVLSLLLTVLSDVGLV